MALLCAQIDSNVIKLVGRWRSNEMLRYLHLQAYPLMGDLAPRMISGGKFQLISHQTIPAAAAPLFVAAGLPATLLVDDSDD